MLRFRIGRPASPCVQLCCGDYIEVSVPVEATRLWTVTKDGRPSSWLQVVLVATAITCVMLFILVPTFPLYLNAIANGSVFLVALLCWATMMRPASLYVSAVGTRPDLTTVALRKGTIKQVVILMRRRLAKARGALVPEQLADVRESIGRALVGRPVPSGSVPGAGIRRRSTTTGSRGSATAGSGEEEEEEEEEEPLPPAAAAGNGRHWERADSVSAATDAFDQARQQTGQTTDTWESDGVCNVSNDLDGRCCGCEWICMNGSHQVSFWGSTVQTNAVGGPLLCCCRADKLFPPEDTSHFFLAQDVRWMEFATTPQPPRLPMVLMGALTVLLLGLAVAFELQLLPAAIVQHTGIFLVVGDSVLDTVRALCILCYALALALMVTMALMATCSVRGVMTFALADEYYVSVCLQPEQASLVMDRVLRLAVACQREKRRRAQYRRRLGAARQPVVVDLRTIQADEPSIHVQGVRPDEGYDSDASSYGTGDEIEEHKIDAERLTASQATRDSRRALAFNHEHSKRSLDSGQVQHVPPVATDLGVAARRRQALDSPVRRASLLAVRGRTQVGRLRSFVGSGASKSTQLVIDRGFFTIVTKARCHNDCYPFKNTVRRGLLRHVTSVSAGATADRRTLVLATLTILAITCVAGTISYLSEQVQLLDSSGSVASIWDLHKTTVAIAATGLGLALVFGMYYTFGGMQHRVEVSFGVRVPMSFSLSGHQDAWDGDSMCCVRDNPVVEVQSGGCWTSCEYCLLGRLHQRNLLPARQITSAARRRWPHED